MSDRQWTVMIYMAGDNNLDSDGISDLNEIKRVGSTDEVAILAQFDRAGRQQKTNRYFLRHRNQSTLREDIVDTIPEANTGSAAELTSFIRWGINTYQAEKYLVIIWGHGTGAYDEDIYYVDSRTLRRNLKRHGVFRPTLRDARFEAAHIDEEVAAVFPIAMTAIAPDDTNKDFLDNVELKKALKDVGVPIDILGMDACLMSMAEVCYQVRDSVGITVASEAEEDLDGWPYGDFLARLVSEPTMSPKELAEAIVDEFQTMYSEVEDAAATLAAINVGAPMHTHLAEKIDVLSTVMIDKFASLEEAISLSRYRAWENELIESIDLADFCYLLRRKTSDADAKAACTDIIDFIKGDDFVLRTARVGNDVRFTTGLGIYFPLSDVSELYSNLDMVQIGTTRWREFINKFVDETQR